MYYRKYSQERIQKKEMQSNLISTRVKYSRSEGSEKVRVSLDTRHES